MYAAAAVDGAVWSAQHDEYDVIVFVYAVSSRVIVFVYAVSS